METKNIRHLQRLGVFPDGFTQQEVRIIPTEIEHEKVKVSLKEENNYVVSLALKGNFSRSRDGRERSRYQVFFENYLLKCGLGYKKSKYFASR